MAKHVISSPLLLIQFLLFILLTTIPSSHSNNHTDLEALLAFKKSIHDDRLHSLSSWNETTQFCRWNGVSCSKRHPSRVVSLSLESQGLVGSLSPHIGSLKVLNLNIRGACKSLAIECNALRNIRHRNLLKIVNVCDSTDFQGNDFKALVYEFMANGSLKNWLHCIPENEGFRALSAIQRLNIAIDVASAVEYLHCGTDSIVIHGDLKPSNILLDQDMIAHVGDFGLAKIISSISHNMSSTEGSRSSAIKGTIGYIAPEYGMSDVLSTQGDVYSCGIFLLELFTNRRPTGFAHHQTAKSHIIADFAHHQTAKSLWDTLAVTFASSTDSYLIYDLRDKASRVIQGDVSLEAYWSRLHGLWMDIDRCPHKTVDCCDKGVSQYRSIKSELRLFKFLTGLNEMYDWVRREILKED